MLLLVPAALLTPFVFLLLQAYSTEATMATPGSMSRIAVVTGANKGIGLAIAQKLAQTEGHTCILTARDEGRGQKAVQDVRRQRGVAETAVVFKQLDIGDPVSVERFAAEMEQEYGRCDILVNNAGIAFFQNGEDVVSSKKAKPTVKTNFFDTVAFTEKMLPLVRKSEDGRIVNVASQLGRLSILNSRSLRDAFVSPTLTKEGVSDLMKKFIESAKSGTHQSEGWPNSSYGVSKLGLIAYTNVLARTEQEAGSGVLVNSCCPGYVATDMTSHMGPMPTEQGARTPYMLTQIKPLREGGVTGKFFQREAISTW